MKLPRLKVIWLHMEVAPVRERGLKSPKIDAGKYGDKVAPVRERGLKYKTLFLKKDTELGSLP